MSLIVFLLLYCFRLGSICSVDVFVFFFFLSLLLFFFFFFQAEDGIRDLYVTGVQTCALPIWIASLVNSSTIRVPVTPPASPVATTGTPSAFNVRATLIPLPPASATPALARWRSEERRVGKECRARWSAELWKETGEKSCASST